MKRRAHFAAGLVFATLLIARLSLADCDPAFKASHDGKCPDDLDVKVGSELSTIAKDKAYDDDCGPDVDLDDGKGPMAHTKPPQDQDGAGICYAEAGSTLYDAYRFAHGDTNTSHRTSPVELAIGVSVEENKGHWLARDYRKDLDGGFTCDAVNYAIKTGSCDQRAVIEKVGDADIKRFIVKFGQIYDEYHKWKSERSSALTVLNAAYGDGHRMRDEGAQLGSAMASVMNCMETNLHFNREMLPDTKVLEAAFEQDDPLRFLQVAMTSACEKGHKYKPFQAPTKCIDDDYLTKPDPKAANARLHALIGAKSPVGISFCASIFDNPSFSGIVSGESHWYGADPTTLKKSCGNHAALVVGQRRDPKSGKCQFKIRNSWGGSCASYSWCVEKPTISDDHKSLQCKMDGWPCDEGEGNVWINADTLSRNTYGLEHLE